MADLVISTLEELKSFRDEVNAGNTFAGKTVELAANIDLMSEEWTPIGNNTNKFQGTFDGKGYTVSNLVITGNNSNAGFFGFTASGAIKNLTIDNASVSGYLNVGVVAGTPYTSTYSNIKLTGVIKVDGYAYVGGMFGKNLYADASDLVIDASDDSYVKANSENYRTYVGGVIGFMGEGNITVSNVASNIRVEGSTCDVGGIVGIAHYNNKFENITCTADEIKVNNDDAEVGGIAGVWHNENGTTVEMINCNISENTVVKTVVDGEETDVTETNGGYGTAYSEDKLAEGGSLLVAEAVKTEDGNIKIEFTVVGGSSENVESRLNPFVSKVVDGATLSGGISYDEDTNTYSYTTSETIVAVADGKYYTDYSAAPAGAEILFVVKQNAIYVNGAWGGQSDIDASLGTDSGVVWEQNAFASLNDAVPVAADGTEIILSGDTPILADAIDVNVNVTLSGNAVIQRNNKNFLIGYGTGDAKLTIAEGSVLDFTNNGTETDGQGIIVSDGRTENGVTDRYHGELFIDNAYVKASYFINRNITTISGDGVAVSNTANFSSSNGFYIGSRPESETGDTNVATVTINNKAFVDASGTNEVLVGYEGAGMLVVNDAKFVADRQNVDVASGSSIQLVNAEFSARSIENAGTVNVSGNSKLAITELTGSAVNIQDGATLTDSNVGGYVWIMGTATLAGDNAFTGVNLYGGSDAVLNIGADAALAVTNDICMRDGSTMNVYGTISASALSIGGSTLTVDGGSLEAYVENYHADQTAQVNIVNGGSVTLTNAYRGLNVSIDTASTLTLTGTVYGDFTFDVTHTGEGDVFAKIVDVVNDNVSIDFSVAVANNGNLVVFGNDLYYSNLDLSVYIVDSEFDSDVVGYGIYKFSNITDAVKAAEANGGATINLTDEAYSGSTMGPANAGLFQTNGTYTFTGGNYIDFVYVDTPRPTTDNAGTVDVNIVFDNAKVTAGKFRLDNGASLTIKDSFVDAQIANGASVGWTTFYGDSTIRVENSVIGWYNTAQTVESSAITAGDRETNYYNVAPYGTAIGDMCYLGSGVMETVGSTVFTYVSEASDRTALGVYDRGLMSFTDSAVYAYTLRVGMSSSNKTVGRDDEVATMIFDNSTLRNSLGEAGERIFVGDGGDTAGTLIIRNNSVVDKAGAAMTVANNGTVWITDSELNVKSLSNEGTVNVSGESKLNISSLTGSIIIADATVKDGTSVGGKTGSIDFAGSEVNFDGKVTIDAAVYSSTSSDATVININDGADVTWNTKEYTTYQGGMNIAKDDTLNVNGKLTVTGDNIYLKGATTVAENGEFNVNDAGFQNTYGKLTVNGAMNITDTYDDGSYQNIKLAGNDNASVYGELDVDGGILTIDAPSFAFGGGFISSGWKDAASGAVTVQNGGKITANAVVFRNGANSELNLDNGTLEFTEAGDFGTVHSTLGTAIDNYGLITAENGSCIDFGDRTFVNDGTVSIIDSELNVKSLSNAGTVNVSGTSTLDVVLTGNGKFNILGGTEDAPTSLSGKITSEDKETDLTLKEGTILLGADTDISLSGYTESVYSEFIVGGTDNTTTDVTDVTMSDGAKVSAQRVWIGGEYDKEKDTAAHTLNVTGSGTLLNGHSQIGVNIRRDGVLNVSDGGEAKASDLVVRGTITVDNAKLTANGGNVYGEGNNIPAVITVENKGVFTASGTQVFQIGHASAADRTGVLNVKNGSIVTVNNLKLEQSGSINMDYTSTLAFDTFVSSGTITVDTAGFSSGVYKIFDDLTGSYTETEYRSLLGDANWNDSYKVIDNDLYLTNLEGAELYVDSAWASMSPNEEVTFVDGTKAYYKLNAFDTVANALALPSGETAYENAVKLNITGAVKSNISVIGSNITEVNSAAKTADENAVIVEDALTVNLVQIDNTEAGWEVYYPLAAGSAASVYGGITTNFVSGLFTFETTRDPNIIGGAYGASDAKIYGSTTVNIGTDGGTDSDVDIYVDALVGSGGGTVNGNSSVNIYSGTIDMTGSIIGGSSWGGVVKGDSSVNIYGGTITDSSDGKSKRGIMGGSYNGVTEGNASVNIYGGTVNGRIYAGGSQAGTTVKGNASVNISDGVVNGSIYGTGGVVEGSISISVTGGTIKGNIYAGGLNVGVAGTKTVNISDYSNPDKDNKNHFYGGSSVTQSGTADALLEIVDGDVIMNVADTEAYADIFGGASVTKSNYVFVEAGSSDVTVKNLLINGYDSGKTIWTGRVYGAGQISNSGNSSVDNYDVYYQASSNVHVTNIGGITVNKDDGSVTHNPGARVYGGGYLYWSRKSEMTVGSTNVVVDEDLQKDSDVKTELAHVIGGSLISGTIDGVNASTIITGNTDVTVNAGVISAWLVGGNNSNWFGRSVIGVADENGSYEYNGEKYSAGSTKVTLNDGGSETLSIIGGSLTDYASYYEAGRLREAVVFGKTEIIMNGGTAYEAVGGGYALYQNQNADTSGKLTGVENPLSNVEGETNVTVNGGTIKSNVIGGGYAYSNQAASLSSIANVTGNTFVAIGGTAAVEGNVYGGGYADGGEADVTGNTSVNVTGGTVAGNIYGGGYHANVNGNATVTITGGTVSGDIYGSGEGEATVNGSRTLNLGSADAAAYAATLNNVYDFNVAQVVNADVTVTGDFSVEEITIAGATLTLNSGFLAATTAVAIEIGAYNVTAAALNVGVSGVNQPSITISAAEELTAGRYLVASGFDSLSGFTVDGINDYTLRLQGEDVYLTKDLAPDDYDANGRPDILMQHDIGKLQVSLVQEDQSVILKDVADLGDGWTILGSGQSGNGENYADIYLTNGETVGIWQLDETTGVTAWQEIQSFDSATHVLGLGDFNGDGITDLLLQNDNGAVGAYLTDGENVGWNYFQSLGSEWSIAGIGDFNHDGIDDVVLQNEKGGYAGIWQLDRNGQVSWSDLDVLNNGQIAGTGDFNGDGFDDVLLKWGNSYGAWTVSGGNLSGWMDLGTLWDSAALEQIGDFNGDGIDDLRVRITNGDLGAFCVLGEGNLQWNYHFSVGSEWQTNLVSI